MASKIGQTWAEQLRLAWNGIKGNAILRSFAALLIDKPIDWGQAAATKGWPIQLDGTPNETAALARIANARGYIADPAASATTTATNLQNAQIFARLSVTPIGMLVAMYNAGFPGARIVTQNGLSWQITSTPVQADLIALATMSTLPSWVTRTVLGNNNPPLPASTDGRPAVAAMTVPWWAFDGGMDGAGNQWSARFGVIFDLVSGTPDPVLGTADNLTRLRNVVNATRPAKALCMGYRVVSAGLYWGKPELVWGAGSGNWGSSTVTTYGA